MGKGDNLFEVGRLLMSDSVRSLLTKRNSCRHYASRFLTPKGGDKDRVVLVAMEFKYSKDTGLVERITLSDVLEGDVEEGGSGSLGEVGFYRNTYPELGSDINMSDLVMWDDAKDTLTGTKYMNLDAVVKVMSDPGDGSKTGYIRKLAELYAKPGFIESYTGVKVKGFQMDDIATELVTAYQSFLSDYWSMDENGKPTTKGRVFFVVPAVKDENGEVRMFGQYPQAVDAYRESYYGIGGLTPSGVDMVSGQMSDKLVSWRMPFGMTVDNPAYARHPEVVVRSGRSASKVQPAWKSYGVSPGTHEALHMAQKVFFSELYMRGPFNYKVSVVPSMAEVPSDVADEVLCAYIRIVEENFFGLKRGLEFDKESRTWKDVKEPHKDGDGRKRPFFSEYILGQMYNDFESELSSMDGLDEDFEPAFDIYFWDGDPGRKMGFRRVLRHMTSRRFKELISGMYVLEYHILHPPLKTTGSAPFNFQDLYTFREYDGHKTGEMRMSTNIVEAYLSLYTDRPASPLEMWGAQWNEVMKRLYSTGEMQIFDENADKYIYTLLYRATKMNLDMRPIRLEGVSLRELTSDAAMSMELATKAADIAFTDVTSKVAYRFGYACGKAVRSYARISQGRKNSMQEFLSDTMNYGGVVPSTIYAKMSKMFSFYLDDSQYGFAARSSTELITAVSMEMGANGIALDRKLSSRDESFFLMGLSSCRFNLVGKDDDMEPDDLDTAEGQEEEEETLEHISE